MANSAFTGWLINQSYTHNLIHPLHITIWAINIFLLINLFQEIVNSKTIKENLLKSIIITCIILGAIIGSCIHVIGEVHRFGKTTSWSDCLIIGSDLGFFIGASITSATKFLEKFPRIE